MSARETMRAAIEQEAGAGVSKAAKARALGALRRVWVKAPSKGRHALLQDWLNRGTESELAGLVRQVLGKPDAAGTTRRRDRVNRLWLGLARWALSRVVMASAVGHAELKGAHDHVNTVFALCSPFLTGPPSSSYLTRPTIPTIIDKGAEK